MRSGGVGRVLAGLRMTESVTLVTTDVVRDTPPDCHFSAWSRPKPAPDPPPGPSVASGVIPTKGGRNGPVPATSGRASTGRWRSSPWKRCNHAAPRSRGQGAPRTARCIKAPTPIPSASVRPAGRGAPCSPMAQVYPVRATGNSCVGGARLTVRRALPPFVARIRMLLCGTSDNLPSVC